ncbi:hypothetical protein Tco_1250985 [Tanacetum coccineum]
MPSTSVPNPSYKIEDGEDEYPYPSHNFAMNIVTAKERDMKSWIRSDSLVTGWILGSLSEQEAIRVVNHLTSKHKDANFSAKDAWVVLNRIYGPQDPQQTEGVSSF